ncbi:hypothetical protein M0813_27931 [Anaeramoeba flamelloides]|uniref:BAP29/BAP31 transmembrane domain-containing protein n=1 Tax=Anaeramoeba flamelloides TaxID=1746091 RepID=A0AAV8A6V8_9EUKA|nr:hypothetical protein M0812_01204 [Anaeramoeba flamelloides]KAJ6236542.1 hypothetical protein M0813_27931 [Anaeramoeba flamelloides]|eukprot:Anaeramoba_flamelloidesa341280_63.p1 GENE.a341280_63~~a341280_63.p1  ORF type:complete len:127 (+),score=31.14 a341280_63:3-383(+)
MFVFSFIVGIILYFFFVIGILLIPKIPKFLVKRFIKLFLNPKHKILLYALLFGLLLMVIETTHTALDLEKKKKLYKSTQQTAGNIVLNEITRFRAQRNQYLSWFAFVLEIIALRVAPLIKKIYHFD